LFKARGGQPIISSIPGGIASAKRFAAEAAASNRKVVRWVTGIGAVAIAAVVLGLIALVYSSWTVMQNGNALAVAASTITKDQGITSEKVKNTNKEIGELRTQVDLLRTQLEQLRSTR
jgi:hypothetical protein